MAGAWFPDNQRALATTIGIMANPLGVLFANLISPRLVRSVEQVFYLNLLTFIPSAIACLIATVAVNRSAPKKPPTHSASQPQMDFVDGRWFEGFCRMLSLFGNDQSTCDICLN